jgi:hypothetical protein
LTLRPLNENVPYEPMSKLLTITLASAFVFFAAGCGGHDDQAKGGNAATTTGNAAATDSGAAANKGPLQTGEVGPGNAAQLPSGTESGGRTTPNPK